ncbi:hypothetical protein K1719_011898 [Acacia pycnantha]|nr:hypothetical protein K1719_011898 [Acacia pycnantha]
MMRSLHHQLGFCLKILYNININQNFNFFNTLSQALLAPEDPYLPICNQRKIRRELANLLQFSDSAVPVLHFKKFHAHIVLLGFHQDVFLTNILLEKYSKGDFLSDAQKLFDTMPERNLITWSSMVSMYTQHN